MTTPSTGCAHGDCCRRRPPDDEDDLETIAGRVVREMLEREIEAPRPSGDFLARASNVKVAIAHALRAEMEKRRSAGAEYVAWPDGSLRVLNHPDSDKDYVWVDRYRVVRDPEMTPLLDFVLDGGLCVVTNRHGSWIVHSPPMQAEVSW